MLISINPATGDAIRTYEDTAPDEIEGRLQKAHDAFQAWKKTTFSERAALMQAVSRVLTENRI